MLKKTIRLFLICLIFSGCSSVPLTGRRQVDFIPSQTMLSMSYSQYSDFIKSNKISSDEIQTQRVQATGQRIQKAVERYMQENNLSGRLSNYQWEFNLVENKEANAWCMPGGKVVVYTGILPVTGDDSGLAVVMSHEIAHAIARHGNERLSQGLLVELGGIGLGAAMQDKPEETRALWMSAFGAGAQLGILLPYNRLQENEADELGLIFMAMAGYDPNAAVGFWERMSKAGQGQVKIEFLSTHPSDEKRIARIKSKIPEAMKYYRR